MKDRLDLIMMLYTMTPTHAGSGTELSFVDLAIQREQHTGFPKIEASTLKGCIRSAVVGDRKSKEENEEKINRIFGSSKNGDFASAVSVTDARLLFFPVKSVVGIFAWITCPYALRRFTEDCSLITGKENPLLKDIEEIEVKYKNPDHCGVAYFPGNDKERSNGDGLTIQRNTCKGSIMLEDYTYRIKADEAFGRVIDMISEHLPKGTVPPEQFAGRTVLLSDDDFTHFVKYATQVSTRIKINTDTGTVDGNALFTEEYLPPESILYSLVFFQDGHLPQRGDVRADNTVTSDAGAQGAAKDRVVSGEAVSGSVESGEAASGSDIAGEAVSGSVESGKAASGSDMAGEAAIGSVVSGGASVNVMKAACVKSEFLRLFNHDVFQIGADSTLGKGFVKKGFWEVTDNE